MWVHVLGPLLGSRSADGRMFLDGARYVMAYTVRCHLESAHLY